VDTYTCRGAATQSTARILIHAGSDVGAGGRHVKSPLQWLRALCSAVLSLCERASLRLQIEDLQGHQVLALEDGGPLVVVALPAGTYHVNAQLGNLRRCYTMTLKEGASFDVYLNLAPVPQ
jgi:hypothetical protein